MPQRSRSYDMRVCGWAPSQELIRVGPAAAVAVHESGRVSCFGPEHEGPRTNERPRPRGILARSALIMAGKTYARMVYDELAVRCEVSPRKAPA